MLPLYKAAPWAVRRYNILQSAPHTVYQTACLMGGFTRQSRDDRPLTAFTFTTSERFARVWYMFARKHLSPEKVRIVIGDTSGSLRRELFPDAEIVPIYNMSHGRKIDLFLRHVIQSPRSLLLDDDQYLLKSIDQLEKMLDNPETPIISLRPRSWYTFRVRDVEYQPMGSYALFMRPVGLSFRPRHERCSLKVFPSGTKAQTWYDTGDYINEQLLLQGYTIPTLKEGDYTAGFDGMTTPSLVLRYGGIAYVRDALKNLSHITPGSLTDAQVRGWYGRAMFEELYTKLFDGPMPPHVTREEIRMLILPRFRELERAFDSIDVIGKKLLSTASS